MLLYPLLFLCSLLHLAHAVRTSVQDIDNYRVYPRRTPEEAAVLEWGHSALISAIDASVARFGPQTSQAALFEVETSPVLAEPIQGIKSQDDVERYKLQFEPQVQIIDQDDEESIETVESLVDYNELSIPLLDNADACIGNLVVMTNVAGMTGIQMALLAQHSGAAALLIVHVDEKRPDDIFRADVDENEAHLADKVEIPVAMISMHSAHILISGSSDPNVPATGLPDRVRLYSGGDRPFFEDVEAPNPTMYLIHNLLTPEECDDLIAQAKGSYDTVDNKITDSLQYSMETDSLHKTQRVHLWQGMWMKSGAKAIEERIEQVTGFPLAHYTDFTVDKLEPGSFWRPRYDVLEPTPALATIHIFLNELDSDEDGGAKVYPSVKGKDPIKINPRRGTAVVHHNLNDKHMLDYSTLHAMLPVSGDKPLYMATKFILLEPRSLVRRIMLPLFALPFRGKLPAWIGDVYTTFIESFGMKSGNSYFDKIFLFVPALLVIGLASLVATLLQKKGSDSSSSNATKKASRTSTTSKKKD